MSAAPTDISRDPFSLIVSDAPDGLVAEYRAALQDAGVAVAVLSDVYHAMLHLAHDSRARVRLVLVDLRHADRAEQDFFRVARHYFPHLAIAALATTPGELPSGVPELTAAQSVARARRILESLDVAVPAPAPVERPAAPPASAAATLHDAVRARMASDLGATPTVRRAPPPIETLPPRPVAAEEAEVSPVELEALLGPLEEPPSQAGAA